MRRIAVVVFLVTATSLAAQTTINNDDSCDLSLLPAATLLLPYFEVDLSDPVYGKTTLFTIQNTSPKPQIARVTLRTDYAYRLVTFNLYLTGYGIQSINVRDVLVRGVIGSASPSVRGELSSAANPHFLPNANATCADMPQTIPADITAMMRLALTGGTLSLPGCATGQIGSRHANAIGYATIDVVATCDRLSAENDGYFTRQILFDNVLTGDYQQVDPNYATGNYAGGNPLVHIRAVPEGGKAGQRIDTNLPFTFYDLYTTRAPSRKHDRRQPLPSVYMPRSIEGGTGAFNTNLRIWREPYDVPSGCPRQRELNASLSWADPIRFDEHENPSFAGSGSIVLPSPGGPTTPVVTSLPTTSSFFPPHPESSNDLGGWIYLNLSNGGSPNYSASRDLRSNSSTKFGVRQSQGWLVTSMTSEGRYSVDMNAVAIGNGCSPAPSAYPQGIPGPAPNVNAEPIPGSPATTNNDDSCDISVLPAATLLLPYFDVDYNSPTSTARTTLFSVQNTTNLPQIARVTILTDWSYPIFTFNLFLTGYDLQSINLYDIIQRGRIAPGSTLSLGGTTNATPPGQISKPNDANPNFLADATPTCANMPFNLPDSTRTIVQQALSTGQLVSGSCPAIAVGGKHAEAIGYVTIDVVANCDTINPLSPDYVTKELLFDNVLTGDYIDINPNPAAGNYAGGNPLVHIRAIPEGGPAGSHPGTRLPHTFYDRYTTNAPSRTFDRRQPLPSAFMPRFIEGGAGGFETNLKIWREGPIAPDACGANSAQSSAMNVAEIIRFDEHENPTFLTAGSTLPAASSVSTSSPLFPSAAGSGDLGGWIYINLNNSGWIITSMVAERRFSVDMDALALGNGCSPAPPLSSEGPIGPAPNINPTP